MQDLLTIQKEKGSSEGGQGQSYYTVYFSGELDETTVEKIKGQIDPIVDDTSVKKIIFDFNELKFINSHALGFLVSIQTHLSKENRNLVIAGAYGTVMDVMTLIGLPSIIKCVKDVKEAIKQ